MSETMSTCPECDSRDHTGRNIINSSHSYYCESCQRPFNPDQWICPWCESDKDVTKNPFDDPREYYCYECNGVFDRLGASFAPNDIEYDILKDGFEESAKQLTLDIREKEEKPSQILECRLQNTGEEPIMVQGCTPIAIQYQLPDNWLTIWGNPEGYTPEESITLPPESALSWDLQFSGSNIRGPGFKFHHRHHSGEYRIIYWGIPQSSTALAACHEIKFRFDE